MLRNTHIWLPGYIRQKAAAAFTSRRTGQRHLLICCADHFEPLWDDVDHGVGLDRVSRWIERYERAAERFRDAGGHPPRHTYFFPLEQYDSALLAPLRDHCRRGFGEVEFHLHHHDDTADALRETLERGKEIFFREGFLGRDRDGAIRYGFVHGDWALDNAHPEGAFCGVNDELSVLHDTGCYADFTLPSAPSPTQTATTNSIYYAVDDPAKPKSHNRGDPVVVGGAPPDRGKYLMIIQGVLGLDWIWRRNGVLPRIENSDLSAGHPPMHHRWRIWLDAAVSVKGRPEWIFIKLHTHGCTDDTYRMLFEEDGFRRLHEGLHRLAGDREDVVVHYMTAREIYNVVKAAEAGETGAPSRFRDYEIAPPGL